MNLFLNHDASARNSGQHGKVSTFSRLLVALGLVVLVAVPACSGGKGETEGETEDAEETEGDDEDDKSKKKSEEEEDDEDDSTSSTGDDDETTSDDEDDGDDKTDDDEATTGDEETTTTQTDESDDTTGGDGTSSMPEGLPSLDLGGLGDILSSLGDLGVNT